MACLHEPTQWGERWVLRHAHKPTPTSPARQGAWWDAWHSNTPTLKHKPTHTLSAGKEHSWSLGQDPTGQPDPPSVRERGGGVALTVREPH